MRALCLAVIVTASVGCVQGGYRVVSSSTAPVWRPSFVVLYGHDPSPPAMPRDCEARGTVQVRGHGEKAYHLGPFREAAQALGGNAVVRLRVIEDERGGHKLTYEGDIVSCRFGDPAVSGASAPATAR